MNTLELCIVDAFGSIGHSLPPCIPFQTSSIMSEAKSDDCTVLSTACPPGCPFTLRCYSQSSSLYLFSCLAPPALSSLKVSQCCRMTFSHTHGESKKKKKKITKYRSLAAGRVVEGGEQDKQKAAETRWVKSPDTETRKMENLSSLESQQSAELTLTRRMTFHTLSHQSD